MSPLLIKISKDFATLWTTIDPIGNVALFAGLTAALTRTERHREGAARSIAVLIALVEILGRRSHLRRDFGVATRRTTRDALSF
jgi:small neutral amino acid transporter SnatA (MarC family)